MEIQIEQIQGTVPVTVMATRGDLDASSYQDLIEAARQAYEHGARFLLLDMTDTSFMSSAGIVALHSIAMLMRGERPPDPEAGWEAFHAIDRDLDSGIQRHVKLLNPQTRVDRALEKTGLKQFFEIFTNQGEAVASFN